MGLSRRRKKSGGEIAARPYLCAQLEGRGRLRRLRRAHHATHVRPTRHPRLPPCSMHAARVAVSTPLFASRACARACPCRRSTTRSRSRADYLCLGVRIASRVSTRHRTLHTPHTCACQQNQKYCAYCVSLLPARRRVPTCHLSIITHPDSHIAGPRRRCASAEVTSRPVNPRRRPPPRRPPPPARPASAACASSAAPAPPRQRPQQGAASCATKSAC